MAKVKLTRQEELKLQKEMDDKRKKLLNEKENSKQKRVDSEYNKIVKDFDQSKMRLNRSELIMLRDKLKTFFNKTI